MYVRVISFGTNWWTMHSDDTDDPLRFRRKAAYFNAAALMSGRRLHHSALVPGQVRFNSKSGLDPEFPQRSVGKVFLCSELRQFQRKTHLLIERPAKSVKPDAYLVTINSEQHGDIDFEDPEWKSPGVQPVSISRRGERYEAMLLLRRQDWVATSFGSWKVDPGAGRLVLADEVGVTGQ